MRIVQKIWTIRIEKLDEKGTREISGLVLFKDQMLLFINIIINDPFISKSARFGSDVQRAFMRVDRLIDFL